MGNSGKRINYFGIMWPATWVSSLSSDWPALTVGTGRRNKWGWGERESRVVGRSTPRNISKEVRK